MKKFFLMAMVAAMFTGMAVRADDPKPEEKKEEKKPEDKKDAPKPEEKKEEKK